VTNTLVRHGDQYTLQGAAGETIEARMNSDELDTYLVLQNDRGELVAENDDGDGRNAVLSAVLPSNGTYTLLATAYGEDTVGNYTLSADRVQINERPVLNTSGQLTNQSETITSRYFRQGKAYTFSGQAGQVVLIELESNEFDTYLIVQNDRGETLAQDDDGGAEGSNSALRFTLPETGTYRVVVTPFNEGYSGAYSLKVSGERLITPAIVETTGRLGD
jgi:serine protease Do